MVPRVCGTYLYFFRIGFLRSEPIYLAFFLSPVEVLSILIINNLLIEKKEPRILRNQLKCLYLLITNKHTYYDIPD